MKINLVVSLFCAWIVWENINDSKWQPMKAFDTKEQCEEKINQVKAMDEEFQKTSGFNKKMPVHYSCLPDSVSKK
jgi:hypothetical protein